MSDAEAAREVGGALRGVEADRVAGASGEREGLRHADVGPLGGERTGQAGDMVPATGPRGGRAGRGGHEPGVGRQWRSVGACARRPRRIDPAAEALRQFFGACSTAGDEPFRQHGIQEGPEVAGQRDGQIAAAALLVPQERRAQRPRVASGGEHGRTVRQRDP